MVKLDPSQHVLYCCPSKDPTEQNCGEDPRDFAFHWGCLCCSLFVFGVVPVLSSPFVEALALSTAFAVPGSIHAPVPACPRLVLLCRP